MSEQAWDLSKAIGYKFGELEVTLTDKDLILYALGIGFQRDPMNSKDYPFTYENADEFLCFPTLSATLATMIPLPK